MGGQPQLSQSNLAGFLLSAATRWPHAIAIGTETECLSFSQLAMMAQSIQLVLRQAFLACDTGSEAGSDRYVEELAFWDRRPDEDIISIALQRGPQCIASIHAAMLEGYAYNAFDVNEPREKLKTWLEGASHQAMISSRPVMTQLRLEDDDYSFKVGRYPPLHPGC